jgi:hypothetical protein
MLSLHTLANIRMSDTSRFPLSHNWERGLGGEGRSTLRNLADKGEVGRTKMSTPGNIEIL